MTPSVRLKNRIVKHGRPHQEDANFGRDWGVSQARPHGA